MPDTERGTEGLAEGRFDGSVHILQHGRAARYTADDVAAIVNERDRLTAEIERMDEALREAYQDGWEDGMAWADRHDPDSGHGFAPDEAIEAGWLRYARRALTRKGEADGE